MKVCEVIEAILQETCGDQRLSPTCDIISIGDKEREVTGIVTTFMATVDVINKAIELGANFIITHEPTWFNASDEEEWCQKDSVYLAKKKLIEDNNLTIWRFHDHMHINPNKDYIYDGFLKEIGWTSYMLEDPKMPHAYAIPETTLDELALFFKEKLSMDTIQVIGDKECKVNRVGILVGGGSLGLGREMMPMEQMEQKNLDVVVCGDITEWTLSAYVNDAKQLGMNKAMIVLGHERSEEAGMKYLAPMVEELLPEIKVTFVDAKEPFRYL